MVRRKTSHGRTLYRQIGNHLKMVRADLGMTQDDVAILCHVSGQTVSNWEKGEAGPPVEHLITIADACHVNLNWLLRGVEPRYLYA
jgi:transcriptional regulator with XRE-family HTH domain